MGDGCGSRGLFLRLLQLLLLVFELHTKTEHLRGAGLVAAWAESNQLDWLMEMLKNDGTEAGLSYLYGSHSRSRVYSHSSYVLKFLCFKILSKITKAPQSSFMLISTTIM